MEHRRVSSVGNRKGFTIVPSFFSQYHPHIVFSFISRYYCLSAIYPELCPSGFYCPEGTGLVWQSCPTGTFSNAVGLYQVSQCTSCTGGSYCSQPNSTTETGQCDAGYYCTLGSDTATPDTGFKGTAGPCPTGHYCSVGTTTPDACPMGTFNADTKVHQTFYIHI